jgi:hypothetical protein
VSNANGIKYEKTNLINSSGFVNLDSFLDFFSLIFVKKSFSEIIMASTFVTTMIIGNIKKIIVVISNIPIEKSLICETIFSTLGAHSKIYKNIPIIYM